jgi:hypothetical protein
LSICEFWWLGVQLAAAASAGHGDGGGSADGGTAAAFQEALLESCVIQLDLPLTSVARLHESVANGLAAGMPAP